MGLDPILLHMPHDEEGGEEFYVRKGVSMSVRSFSIRVDKAKKAKVKKAKALEGEHAGIKSQKKRRKRKTPTNTHILMALPDLQRVARARARGCLCVSGASSCS